MPLLGSLGSGQAGILALLRERLQSLTAGGRLLGSRGLLGSQNVGSTRVNSFPPPGGSSIVGYYDKYATIPQYQNKNQVNGGVLSHENSDFKMKISVASVA
jgi:hypothetical protein